MENTCILVFSHLTRGGGYLYYIASLEYRHIVAYGHCINRAGT